MCLYFYFNDGNNMHVLHHLQNLHHITKYIKSTYLFHYNIGFKNEN